MNENIKELIESLPNSGVDCKGREWVRYKPTSSRFIDRAGEVYGRLTALFPVKEKEKSTTKWLCFCECKNLIVVDGTRLEKNIINSCGNNLQHRYDKKREEMIDKRFGKLTVLSFEGVHKEKAIFKCCCDCGKEILVRGNDLKSGNTTSCGCSKKEAIHKKYENTWSSFIGTKINHLTAIEFIGTKNNKSIFKFLCDCGNTIISFAYNVKSGSIKSCGCQMKETIHKKYEETWNSFIGTKINFLTATKFIGTENGKAMFEFECECGNKTVLSANAVKPAI